MKQFFYILLIPFFLFQYNSTKLVGKYKLQYNNSSLPKYTVTFNDSSYLKKSTSFLHITNGKIYYSKNIVTMRDENSNLIINFFLKDIQNDTIQFGVKDINGKGNYLDISIYSGTLIKIED